MSRGATPEITWEPWDPRLGATQPAYQLQRIVNGAYDTYLTRWADEIKQWGNPLIIRLAHEMNTANYPWSASANGNSSAAYVAFWRHVRAVFAARGVTNVTWVWCPNVGNPATYAALYPGDAYVDQVGLDGYNGGTALPWGGWLSFSQLFGRDLTALESLSSKPVVIGETSSVERGGSKSTWIRSMFTAIAADSRIVAVTWFDFDKEADWRVQSSTAAVTAFHAGSTGARFG
jgi:beta-mannanase